MSRYQDTNGAILSGLIFWPTSTLTFLLFQKNLVLKYDMF